MIKPAYIALGVGAAYAAFYLRKVGAKGARVTIVGDSLSYYLAAGRIYWLKNMDGLLTIYLRWAKRLPLLMIVIGLVPLIVILSLSFWVQTISTVVLIKPLRSIISVKSKISQKIAALER